MISTNGDINEDEECVLLATQVEKEVLGTTSNVTKTKTPTTFQKENDLRILQQNYKILQNKASALERQVLIMREREREIKTQNDNLKQEKTTFLKTVEREKSLMEIKHKQLTDENQTLKQNEHEFSDLKERLKLIDQSKARSASAATEEANNISDEQINTINIMVNFSTDITQHVSIDPVRLKMVFAVASKKSTILAEEISKSRILLQNYLNLSQGEKNTIEGCFPIFSELIPIISQLCKVIKAEGITKHRVYFTRSGFVNKQVEILSEELNLNHLEQPKDFYRNMIAHESELSDEFQSFLGDAPKPLNDKDINKRILLEILAAFAAISEIMSYLFVYADTIDAKEAKGNSNEIMPPETILDMISNTTKKCIIPLYGLADYWALSDGLAAFAVGISRHYKKFENHTTVDKTLAQFFNALVMISLSNTTVLLKLTEFVINIAKGPDCDRLFSKLCKNVPVEYSKIHQMIKIPCSSCELQVLFLLLVNVFPYKEDVPEHQLDNLFKLTKNLNTIAYHFFCSGKNMACIEKIKDFEVNSCKCLYSIIVAITTLNKKVLEQRFRYDQKYCQQIKSAIKSYMNSAVIFLRYTRNLKLFWDMKTVHLELNHLYSIVTEGESLNKIK